jgi:hypothetical protein
MSEVGNVVRGVRVRSVVQDVRVADGVRVGMSGGITGMIVGRNVGRGGVNGRIAGSVGVHLESGAGNVGMIGGAGTRGAGREEISGRIEIVQRVLG